MHFTACSIVYFSLEFTLLIEVLYLVADVLEELSLSSFTLKMHAACFCYTLVTLCFCQTSRRHIPENRNLHNHSYEVSASQVMSVSFSVLESLNLSKINLKSLLLSIVFEHRTLKQFILDSQF
jgi:dipeptide/tripeptide permease